MENTLEELESLGKNKTKRQCSEESSPKVLLNEANIMQPEKWQGITYKETKESKRQHPGKILPQNEPKHKQASSLYKG